jgi:hypothetical protein
LSIFLIVFLLITRLKLVFIAIDFLRIAFFHFLLNLLRVEVVLSGVRLQWASSEIVIMRLGSAATFLLILKLKGYL